MTIADPSPTPVTQRRFGARGGFTLVELLVSSGVGTLIVGSVMLLLIESAKEQRRGMADSTVERVACDLEDELMRTLRGMSATEGVVFSGSVTNAAGQNLGFSRIIVARGPTPDYPREEIYFIPTNGLAVHDPNRSVSNNERVLLQTKASVYLLRALAFQPSFKSDGSPDNSLLNILIEVDDNGSSGRRAVTNPAHVQRTFAVKMRNN